MTKPSDPSDEERAKAAIGILDGLDYKPHFGIQCICGKVQMCEVPEDKLEEAKAHPITAFKLFSEEQQRSFAEFWMEHDKPGHYPEPCLVGLSPLPDA